MKKLNAFTLIELLVAMAVSSIVVSASYFCFTTVTRQMSGFRSAADKITEVALLKMLLQNDVHVFPLATKESEYELAFSGTDENKVSYQFGSNFILREQNSVSDTFHIKTTEIKMTFEKKSPQEGHALVDEITFGVELADSVYTMRFSKEYAPDVLMNSIQ